MGRRIAGCDDEVHAIGQYLYFLKIYYELLVTVVLLVKEYKPSAVSNCLLFTFSIVAYTLS